jgi:acetyl esterase/lipase
MFLPNKKHYSGLYLVLVTFCFLVPLFSIAQVKPDYKRVEDVIYGRKYGTALTLDVFQPLNPNGFGIIFLVSGGWFSSHDTTNMVTVNYESIRPFLDRGYTVFAVVHGSQPKYTILEIVQDLHRAVRFIRHNACEYGVNPDHLGITGASSGGQLALMIATQGGNGITNAPDPVDRESSAVEAAAVFFSANGFFELGCSWNRCRRHEHNGSH